MRITRNKTPERLSPESIEEETALRTKDEPFFHGFTRIGLIELFRREHTRAEKAEQQLAKKDAEIERLKEEVELHRNGEFDDSWQYQCQENERLEKEIERLNAQLLDILNLQHKGLTGGEWILKAHKAEEEVERLKGENASLVERMERGKKLIITASEVLGEYGTLSERLAEAVRLLSEAPDNWNGTHRTGCDALTRRRGVCNCGRDAWEQAILAFLQKHTPPLNFGSAAAGESPSHSGGGEPAL